MYATTIIKFDSKTKTYKLADPFGDQLWQTKEQLLKDYLKGLRSEFGEDLEIYQLGIDSLCYPLRDIRPGLTGRFDSIFGFLVPADEKEIFELRYVAILEV